MIPLAGKHIKLRAVEPSDLDILYKWENDPANWLVSNTTAPFSRHVLRKYLENAHLDIYEARQLRLMIERLPAEGLDDDIIGIIDLFDFDPLYMRAGIGILIASEEDRNRGLATEALTILIDHAFRNLRLHQVYCYISEDNAASLKLFRKLGFRETGRQADWIRSGDKWLDVFILQKLNDQAG